MADIIYAQPQGQGSSWLKDLIPVAILGALALGGLWLLSKSGLLSGEGSSTSLDTGDSGPAGPGTSPSTGTSDLGSFFASLDRLLGQGAGGKNAAAQSVISASKAASNNVSLQGTITNTGGQINTMQQSTLAAIQKALAAGQASVTTVRGAAAPVAVITTPAGPGTPITDWPTPSVGTNTVVIGTSRVLSPAEAAANAQTILNAEPVQALMQQGIVAPLNNQPSSQGIVSGTHNQCTQQDYANRAHGCRAPGTNGPNDGGSTWDQERS